MEPDGSIPRNFTQHGHRDYGSLTMNLEVLDDDRISDGKYGLNNTSKVDWQSSKTYSLGVHLNENSRSLSSSLLLLTTPLTQGQIYNVQMIGS